MSFFGMSGWFEGVLATSVSFQAGQVIENALS